MQIGKVVILAGGLGTRLSEETDVRPKPMIEIGGRPMLWHIMKIYSYYGLNDFVVCLGYKGYVIKEFFSNYYLHLADVTFDIGRNTTEIHRGRAEPWRITLVDTGTESMTGGRLRRVRDYIGDQPFCLTYGDGVADVDIGKLTAFHASHGGLATVTAVLPPGRFGALKMGSDGVVQGFREKPEGDGDFINGGFFVFSPKVIDYIAGDDTPLEAAPLMQLAADGELHAYHHTGFWHAMDTLRDRRQLEAMWSSGSAPWKVW
jgi:glucose-1-phosphate cytidylyltransferase